METGDREADANTRETAAADGKVTDAGDLKCVALNYVQLLNRLTLPRTVLFTLGCFNHLAAR